MNQGYVKMWRKSLDSACFQNDHLWRFWCWCLMRAAWKPKAAMVGFRKIDLEPGQFVFGRRKAAQELQMSERTIRTCLQHLENLENLTIKTTNKFSIITINNWDTYQSDETTNDQQSDQQATSKRPANDHKQESKEVKERKNKETPPTPPRGEKTPQTPQGGDSGETLPPWMPAETWKTFKAHRRLLKSPMSPKAEQLTLKKLQAFMDAGQNPEEIINQSIEHGWKGVFPLKGVNGGKGPQSTPSMMGKAGSTTWQNIQALRAMEAQNDKP